ncbi:MAG: M48 family metallopeptidase [Deltaproteobacteria bacterium]|nr:M48 family metallopeptidase [Deltaproteobacteria bacterium]
MVRLRKLLIFLVIFLLPQGVPLEVSAKKSKEKAGKHLWDYKRQHKTSFSMEQEIKIGTHYLQEQIKIFRKKNIGVDLPKHAKLKNRINHIVRKIAKVSDMPDLPYEVHVFDMPKVVNAYCLPGGKIGVFSGLFDPQKGLVDINNDAQIAAILSHEISHATMRHATRQISSAMALNALGSIASIALGAGVGSSAQFAFDSLFSLSTNLIMPGYSRKHEKEADRVGFYYMSKAGYNPEAAVQIWEQAANRKDKHDKKNAFASHPSDGSRAKALKKWLPEAMQVYKKEITLP